MPTRRLPEKDFPWTPELAYVVGLLVTDGCLSNNNRTITIVSQDREILENFKTCLNITNKIGDHVSGIGNHYLKIQYGNVQFYDWLLKIGLFQAKSYTIGKIEELTGVRGFITYSKSKIKDRVPLWGLKFAKKKSLRIIEWMYYTPDVPCLHRKRKIAEEAVRIITQQKRRKYTKI